MVLVLVLVLGLVVGAEVLSGMGGRGGSVSGCLWWR